MNFVYIASFCLCSSGASYRSIKSSPRYTISPANRIALGTVKTDITQIIVPRQGNYMKEDGQMASRPLEDMVPLIDRDEFEEVMRNDDSE